MGKYSIRPIILKEKKTNQREILFIPVVLCIFSGKEIKFRQLWLVYGQRHRTFVTRIDNRIRYLLTPSSIGTLEAKSYL